MRRFAAPPCEVQSPIVVNNKQKVITTAILAHVIWDGALRAGGLDNIAGRVRRAEAISEMEEA
jgi:hypothetical protein